MIRNRKQRQKEGKNEIMYNDDKEKRKRIKRTSRRGIQISYEAKTG